MLLIDDKKWETTSGNLGWKGSFERNFQLKKPVTFWLMPTRQSLKTMKRLDQRGGGTKVKAYPPFDGIPPHYRWVDPGTGNAHTIRYVEDVNPQGIKSKTIAQYLPVLLEFDKGFITVPVDKLDLYWFLQNHPGCRTNKIYWKDGKENESAMAAVQNKFVFYEQNEDKDKKVTNDNEKLRIEAEYTLYKELTEAEKRELYASFGQGNSEDESMDTIELYLLAQAKNNPADFMSKLDDDIMKLKAIVTRAEEYKIIKFNKNTRAWIWVEGGSEAICTVVKGGDPIGKLVTYLREKDVDSEILHQLNDRIKNAKTSQK